MLMGCSWGVPNYQEITGESPESHLEFLLKNLGHTVYNCSQNAGSNMHSLCRAIDLLDGIDISHPTLDQSREMIKGCKDLKIDLVIWFHTDPGRDLGIIDNKNKSISDLIEEICSKTYQSYGSFFEHIKSKIVIIGACADIHPCIDNYIKYDFLLPSWQQELIGISTKFFRIESGLKTPTAEDVQLIENTIAVINKMKENKVLFPDGCHPGKIPHQKLFNRLCEESILIAV